MQFVQRSLFSTAAPSLMKLKDQVCFITGGGSGIGKAIAKTYGKEGAKVFVTSQTPKNVDRTVEEIRKLGGEATGFVCDVTKENDIKAAVKACVAKYGKLTTCLSNAGVQHIEPVHELSYENWRKVLNIHLDAAFLCTKHVLPQMYKQEFGKIIYIGSAHSHTASVLKAPYCAAKHGILGLARVVAKEAGPKNVSANTICPGFVWTPLVEKQIPQQAKKLGITEEEVVKNVMLKDTFDHKFSTVEDVCDCAKFLSEFPTTAISGQSYVISHGWVMH